MSNNKNDDSTFWQVADGLIFGVLVLTAIDRWQTNRAIATFNKQMQQISVEVAADQKMARRLADERRQRLQQDAVQDSAQGNMGYARGAKMTYPLNPGERCISGQKFRRLTNGWEEIGTC